MRRKNKILVVILMIALFIGMLPYGIKQTTSKATGYGISNPRVKQDDTVTWDCIYFGNYYQNTYQPKQIPDNPVSGNKYVDSDGTEMIYEEFPDRKDKHVYYKKEPIKWRVLSVDGDNAFLLADQNLDVQKYNVGNGDVVWANSPLREWLNDEFYNIAFASSEQGCIVETDATNEDGTCVKDKVSLLSLTEACNAKYGFNCDSSIESETRKSKNTEYAIANGAFTYEGNGAWWLRSYYNWAEEIYRVCTQSNIELISNFFLGDTNIAVRPCLHLNLSSNTWSKADTVTATGGTFATPTPVVTTPTPTPKVTPTPIPSYYPRPTYGGGIPVPTPTSKPTATPRTITAPSKPTKLSAKNSKKKSVTLSWKKVKGATGYQVQYATNEAFSRKSKNTKKTKITIKKLKKKKTYSFRVRAYVLNGKKKIYGKWSAVKSVKIKR